MEIGNEDSAFAALGQRSLVGNMHTQLDELLDGRDQMEHLLRVIVGLAADLDLDATLRRIVEAAMELTGSQYGALGVQGVDGHLVSFLHSGIDDAAAATIGRLPVGKGVLGVLVEHPELLRLRDLAAHPSSAGFPEHHPPMQAFLGVPIIIRQKAFGSLYLTQPKERSEFNESDEIVAQALAAAAAVAIDNARLFEQARSAAKWVDASREIMTALLADANPVQQPLRLIAGRACELTRAEQGIVLVPSDPDLPAAQVHTLLISTAVGLWADDVVGQEIPVDGSTTGGVYRSRTPLITESFRHPIQAFTDVGQRPAIVMPLCDQQSVLGVLAVARNKDDSPFDASHLELMRDFADHAVVAVRLSESREQAREITLIAERERIAHDLHDHVIQRLFAAGMDLQGTIARSHSNAINTRLSHTVDDLQSTINEIRSTIFALQSPTAIDGGFRQRIQTVIAELTHNRDIETTVHLSGPLIVVGHEVAEHAVAVVAEGVSNAVRHSGAVHLVISIAVGDEVTVDITDDGCGIDPANLRRSGLANFERRAKSVSGTCSLDSHPGRGTHIRWVAPLTTR